MIKSVAYDILQREAFCEGFLIGFITGFERGELKQARKCVCLALKVRFPHVPVSILERIETITSLPIFNRLLVETVTASNLAEFETVMTQLLKESKL